MNKCPFNHGERPRDDVKAPRRIRMLPKDKRGFHVPWFVGWVNGEPEFRTADGRKVGLAIKNKQCWVCGQKLEKEFAFVIGPMCAVIRVSAEPPSHLECADYSVKVCPFLNMPQMRRRENDLPEQIAQPAGIAIRRNPGVTLVWITSSYKVMRVHNGLLFMIGEAVKTLWFREGREATRAEILESINSGLPILEKVAKEDGPDAEKMLALQVTKAMELVPA